MVRSVCHPPFAKSREGWGTLCVVCHRKAGPPARGEVFFLDIPSYRTRQHLDSTRDKVQVIGTVVAMQAARHDKHYAISGIAAHPCKKRKDGAPTFRYGKGRQSAEKGWASPQPRPVVCGSGRAFPLRRERTPNESPLSFK